MSSRRQSGFTLVELVLAMSLLATMMVALYSGLAFAMRSWDLGEAVGRLTADRRIGENFLRRELSEIFPMRWKEPTQLKFAFEGRPESLRFVSSRPAGLEMGGLSLVGLSVEGDPERGGRHLVMRRAMPDDEARDFGPLEAVKRATVLVPEVDRVTFSYFGAENDFVDPRWMDDWKFVSRMPLLVRVSIRTAAGETIPDMVVRVMLGEEAGCLESSFQRQCRPRRQ